MGKKKRKPPASAMLARVGWEPITPTLKHVNATTMGANASTEAAEAIDNSGYSDVAYGTHRTGMLFEDVMIDGGQLESWSETAATTTWISQLQVGERATSITPVLVEPSSPFILASMRYVASVTSSGRSATHWPKPMTMLRRPPILVVPQFTICHKGESDVGWNSLTVYTTIFFRIVRMTDELFSAILQDQQRTS